MSGDNYLKHITHAYLAHAQKIAPFEFKGPNSIPHNPKNNRKTKSKGKK
ncbi:hypothetical protein [Psychrobacter sp. KCTC 72983]|nr:hypothetical protein [Psychrobacter sp. KCTC 72983]